MEEMAGKYQPGNCHQHKNQPKPDWELEGTFDFSDSFKGSELFSAGNM